MSVLEPVVSLLNSGTTTTPQTGANTPSASINSPLSGFNTSANKGDSVSLSDSARASSAANGNVARTNSASAAAQQASNASASSATPAAQQASDAGADYSQAFRSLAALKQMTLAYNKALESAASAEKASIADSSASASDSASQLRARNMSTSTGTEATDSTQVATDLSRSGTLSSILMSSQVQNDNHVLGQDVGSDRRNAVKSVAKV